MKKAPPVPARPPAPLPPNRACRPGDAASPAGFADSLAWHLRAMPPLGVFLAAMVLMMGLIILSQMLAQQELYFLYKMWLGADYSNVYKAAEVVLAGGSPYDPPFSHPFAAPPLPAIVNIPFTYLPFATASVIISLLTFAAVVASMFVVHRIFYPPPAWPHA